VIEGTPVLTMDYVHNGLGQRVKTAVGGTWAQAWPSYSRDAPHWHDDEAGHLRAMHVVVGGRRR